jgi:hypothetical protein
MIRSKHNDKITSLWRYLASPTRGADDQASCASCVSQRCNSKVPKRQPMQPDAPSQTSSLLFCVCDSLSLSLSLSLCLCLFNAEAKQRRGRWDRAPLRQLLQCTKQVELWFALAWVRMSAVWLSKWSSDLLLAGGVCLQCDCERLFRHFVKNILEVKYV